MVCGTGRRRLSAHRAAHACRLALPTPTAPVIDALHLALAQLPHPDLQQARRSSRAGNSGGAQREARSGLQTAGRQRTRVPSKGFTAGRARVRVCRCTRVRACRLVLGAAGPKTRLKLVLRKRCRGEALALLAGDPLAHLQALGRAQGTCTCQPGAPARAQRGSTARNRGSTGMPGTRSTLPAARFAPSRLPTCLFDCAPRRLACLRPGLLFSRVAAARLDGHGEAQHQLLLQRPGGIGAQRSVRGGIVLPA